MSAGLAASIVTPGRTAPDESRTTPAIDAWAYAIHGSRVAATAIPRIRPNRLIQHSFAGRKNAEDKEQEPNDRYEGTRGSPVLGGDSTPEIAPGRWGSVASGRRGRVGALRREGTHNEQV